MSRAIALWINERFFAGWAMLLVAALGMFVSGPGQSHMFSVFVTPIGDDLGLSRTLVSTAYAAASLAAGFGLPYVGRLIDRHGVRRVMLVVVILFGASAAVFGSVANIAMLALGFGALRFLGQGSLMLTCTNIVAQWFSRKRGFALSLMSLGFSASMALHPPFAQWLIDNVGWREAWLWLGVLTWVLLIPPIVFLVQNRPEDLGLSPDGISDDGRSGADGSGDLAHAAHVGLSLSQALRTTAFWIVALSLGTLSTLITGMFFHLVSIFESQGLTPQLAARVFPVSAIAMVVAMPLIGRLLDRFPTKPMFAGAVLSIGCSLIVMAMVRDLTTAFAYAVVFGVANAAVHAHFSYVWPRFFGRRYLGSIQGAAQTVAVLGSSFGPVPLGAAYDMFGSYTGALIILAVLPVVCAVAVLFMKPPDLSKYVEPQAT